MNNGLPEKTKETLFRFHSDYNLEVMSVYLLKIEHVNPTSWVLYTHIFYYNPFNFSGETSLSKRCEGCHLYFCYFSVKRFTLIIQQRRGHTRILQHLGGEVQQVPQLQPQHHLYTVAPINAIDMPYSSMIWNRKSII